MTDASNTSRDDYLRQELQQENALLPILFTLEGITTSDRELQQENALLPMLVTLEGMTYDSTL